MLIESAPPDAVPAPPQGPEFKLLSGPPAYRRIAPWRPISIVGTAVVLLVVAVIWANIYSSMHELKKPEIDDTFVALTLIFTPIQQLIMIGLAVWAAYAHGGDVVDALALRAPAQGWRAYVGCIGLYLLAVIVMGAALHYLQPGSNDADTDPFKKLLTSPYAWAAMLLVGVGAPLSEELLFRGYLFRWIAQTPLGVVGAAVGSSAFFSLMHSYSVIGMTQVFVIGMIFSWILVRTGSLRVTMLIHAIYNSVLAVLLMIGADSWV